MITEKFQRDTEDSLIVIEGGFPNHKVFLALDTGASHTTLDLSTLIVAGYDFGSIVRVVSIETGNGIIEAYVFLVRSFTALGITRKDVEICTYDFGAHDVHSDFDGVLGLDFLDQFKVCIDFKRSEITLHD